MTSYKTSDEYELIIMAQSGDDGAMDFLLKKYKELVKYLSSNLYLCDGDRDDLIQEGMIGLFRAVMSYDAEAEASFRTYATRCINRQMYSAIRRSKRRKNEPLNTYISIDDDSREQSFEKVFKNPEEIMIRREEYEYSERKLLEKLSAFEKKVLMLLLEEHDYKEIAVILGKHPKSIDNAIQRIRAKKKSC